MVGTVLTPSGSRLAISTRLVFAATETLQGSRTADRADQLGRRLADIIHPDLSGIFRRDE